MKVVYIFQVTIIKNDEPADTGQMKLWSRFLWLLFVVYAAACAVLAPVVFPAKLPADEKIHVIQGGDTIYSLARAYGVSSQDILSLNGIKDPKRIQKGQKIRIPGTIMEVSASPKRDPQPQTAVVHRVAGGETIYGIARQYGISPQTLCSANSLPEDYKVKTGERLLIPETGNRAPPAPQNPAPMVPARPPAVGIIPASPLGSNTGVRSTESRTLDPSVSWPILAREMAYMTGKLNGVVLTGERNEPVKSLKEGVVISAGPYRGFGKVAIIQVTGGYLYVYGGCESLSVREGDRVNPGTELGRLGMDALSERPQLFFLVYRNSVSMDPALAPRN
jgi:murein DD-endopeptidase MepM/ murein hydrolase activator NlpD